MKDLEIPGWFYDYASALEHLMAPKNDVENQIDRGMYPFIPYPPSSFLRHMREAAVIYEALHPKTDGWRKDKPIQFVDVGGGIGSKARLAESFLFHSLKRSVRGFNIEYNKSYCELSNRLLRPGKTINKDARVIRRGYSQFDIIYFYCPMADYNLQKDLEKIIYDGSKEGSIHIQVMKQNHSREQQPLLQMLNYGLFVKTSDLSLVEKAKAALSAQSVTIMEP